MLFAAGANAQSMDPDPRWALEPQAGMTQLIGDGSEYFARPDSESA